MARLFIDGAEAGQMDLWDINSGTTIATASTYGMDESYCFNLNNASGNRLEKVIAEKSELYISFWFRYTGITSGGGILTLYNNATIIGGLSNSNSSSDANFDAFVNAVGSDVATTPLIYLRNTTYKMEFRYQMADSGIIQLKINGKMVINYSGDTKPGSATTINKIRFGYNGSYNSSIYLDNIRIDDADWTGNTRIQAIFPTGAGATTNLTPSAGSNWDCVEEKPASDSEYVYTNAVDQIDTYVMGNLGTSPYSILCVAVQARAVMNGNPTPQNAQLIVRPSSTDRLSGTDLPIYTEVLAKQGIWELNPEDSEAWEEADVNGMETGVKVLT